MINYNCLYRYEILFHSLIYEIFIKIFHCHSYILKGEGRFRGYKLGFYYQYVEYG